MRRLCAWVVMLAVAAVASPAWALASADHSCCAPTAAVQVASRHTESKHAHCPAMSRRPSQPQVPSHTLSALHQCKACGLSALTSPQNAIGVVAESRTLELAVPAESCASSQQIISRTAERYGVRGPPSFLI